MSKGYKVTRPKPTKPQDRTQARVPAKAAGASSSRRKPAPHRLRTWFGRLMHGRFGVLIVGSLFICVALGLLGLIPASIGGARIVAAVLATDTPTPTETTTPTHTPMSATVLAPGRRLNLLALFTPRPAETPTPTPLPTPDGRSREVTVPILMYHYVSVPPADADVYRHDLSVTPQRFRQQMGWLADNGYHTVTLYDLLYALTRGRSLPPKSVILTFDDGYVDNYKNAFPILKRHGMVASFFVLTGPIDEGNPDYMTWDMLREMHHAGMDIELHGRDHLEMTDRSHDFLIYQMLGGAQTIEAEIGVYPRFFSYPSGLYDEQAIQVLQEVDFWGAVSVTDGVTQSSDHLYELRRIRMRGDYTLDQFIYRIERGEES
jgi:peptidoglycan/xylan/chitin deacetylase (PgdA/CDA1 family)